MIRRIPAYCSLTLFVLTAWMVAACTSGLEKQDDGSDTGMSLVLSMGDFATNQNITTKMPGSITQSNGVFRGIEEVFVVPFATGSSDVGLNDQRIGSKNIVIQNPVIAGNGLIYGNNSRLFQLALMPWGMDHVLAYGKAPDSGDITSKEGKHNNGVLTPDGLDDPSQSSDITFHLEPVLTTTGTDELDEVITTIDEILDKLNNVIANIRMAKTPSIVSIVENVKRDNQILACSYTVFNRLRTEIQSALVGIEGGGDVITDKIRINQALNEYSNVLYNIDHSFPASYGIPEGAIGFQWNGTGFVRLIGGVNIALVDPSSYCYPPSLWYYSNSPVKTANDDSVHSLYTPASETWNDILVQYTAGESVSYATRSVAIVNPLCYGVGMLELSFNLPGADALQARDCPLTGIIIGDQKDVNFRFRPAVYPSAPNPSRFVYDTVDGTLLIGETGTSVETLVLPTSDNATVHFALEFQNTTGTSLYCQQGEILPWAKFYLAGKLVPENATSRPDASVNSVFMSHRKTSVSVSINELRNAYNTVPDLHDPQLEIGIMAEIKWNQLTPQSITMHL
ncbi:MAG: hypothetical protein J6W74_02600 [Bacteroidales bacterium]|nr:hypothetical protein [Bacteroidales bacterium]